eukprot:TRINITY_DN5653_c4_g1_i1.p1 TRINITY_DN5653_c4_g1~~TRINITY_DN5653_c4_g1_i1.p1  ORF type:complete len:508 (+),score=122.92 TRINITY_DN5653_c4_g1_i1:34-1557(+)
MPRRGVESDFGIAHSPIRPTLDAESRNIVVNSVQLAERERETRLLRKQLAQVKSEHSKLCRLYDSDRDVINRLKARLSSGGLAVGFENLDAKYQALLKRMHAREEAYRRLEAEHKELQLHADSLSEAVNFRADELQIDAERLIDIAKGGKLLSQRDEAIATLNIEYENAEKEASQLKLQLLQHQEDFLSSSQQLEKQSATIMQLKTQLESTGSKLDEQLLLVEQATNEKTALTAKYDSLASCASELKKVKLYNDVLTKQLEQAREAYRVLEEQVSEMDGSKRDEMIATIAELKAQVSTTTSTNNLLQQKCLQFDDISRERDAYANNLRDQTSKLSSAEQQVRELQLELSEYKRHQEADNADQISTLTESITYLTEENKRLKGALKAEHRAKKEIEDKLKTAEDGVSRMKLLQDVKRRVSSHSVQGYSQSRSRSPGREPSIVESAFAMATTPPSTGSLPGAPTPQSFTISEVTATPASFSPSQLSNSSSRPTALHEIAFGSSPSAPRS